MKRCTTRTSSRLNKQKASKKRQEIKHDPKYGFSSKLVASRLKSVVHTDITQPSQSLIKSVCYPEKNQFKSCAIIWGCEHDVSALEAYKQKEGNHHIDFSISKSGFCVHHLYPFMSASPDGIMAGKGVLEIKCPYSCRDKSLLERVESRFFLKADEDGKLSLDITHLYHYQVQAQLKFYFADYYDYQCCSQLIF